MDLRWMELLVWLVWALNGGLWIVDIIFIKQTNTWDLSFVGLKLGLLGMSIWVFGLVYAWEMKLNGPWSHSFRNIMLHYLKCVDTQHEAEFNMVEYEDGNGGDSLEDDDRMEDDDNNVEEVVVNMDKFISTFENDLDFDQHEDNEDEDQMECDLNDFDSDSEDEEGSLLNLAMKKFRKRKKKSNNIEEVPFYVGQSFTNKEDIKNLMKSHDVDTRRQLCIVRNEKLRFRVVCLGMNPVFVSSEVKVKSDMRGSSLLHGLSQQQQLYGLSSFD
ncbi:hypothetical protein R6Q59_002462 [Mikania micrantha]